MQRNLITLGLVLIAAFVAFAVINGGITTTPGSAPATGGAAPASVTSTNAAATATTTAPISSTNAQAQPAATPAISAPIPTAIKGLHAVPVTEAQDEPVLGDASNDPTNPFFLQARFTPYGGGIKELALSRYSFDVQKHVPYIVQQRLEDKEVIGGDGKKVMTYRYPMAAYAVTVNGQSLFVFADRWKATKSGGGKTGPQTASFTLDIADADNKPVLRITRTWSLKPGDYDVELTQKLENLSGSDLAVQFTHFGQGDLPFEESTMGDTRHVISAVLQHRKTDTIIETHDQTRDAVVKAGEVLWPTPSTDTQPELLWVAATNRYFTAVLHPAVVEGTTQVAPLKKDYLDLRRFDWIQPTGKPGVVLVYDTPVLRLGSGAAASTEIRNQLYTGPRDPNVLGASAEYTTLGLNKVIVYNLGGMCSICTFAWLAEGLLKFLTFLHMLTRDWAVAIICLVAIVRSILHPLTKNSQVNMMKMSKQMQAVKPELDKLKERYADNKEKLQAETMRLYKEKGINPAAMGLGCLPMFLQMPIWVALYAMLYYAIELRHQPAFYGVFQAISGGKWPFLADLAASDHFIPLPESMHVTLPMLGHVTSINLLPVLLGIVFFIQQKYMQAQQTNVDPQVAQQQAIMKWMVLLFPLMLYNSPCGLTLYIFASTSVGIIESKRVRAHLKQLEAEGKLFEKKPNKPGGFMDRLMKAAEERMKQQGGGPGNDGLSGNVRRKPRKD